MNREEYAAWVQAAWVKDVMHKTPGAKLARQLKAGQRESKKAWGRARRSMAAAQASSKRKLNQRLAELERESRDRREALAREFEEKQWALLMGKSSS